MANNFGDVQIIVRLITFKNSNPLNALAHHLNGGLVLYHVRESNP